VAAVVSVVLVASTAALASPGGAQPAPQAASRGAAQAQAQGQPPADPQAHVVNLKSRRFEPRPGLDQAAIQRAAGPDGRVHFFLQVHDLPDEAGRRQLTGAGVRLLNYVGGHTYIASAAVGDVPNLRNVPNVRWAGPIEPDDKTTPDTKADRVGSWARDGRGQVILDVQVHPDVTVEEARATVERLGGTVLSQAPTIPSVTAAFRPGQANRLIREDVVQYVDAVAPRLGNHNDGAVPALNATPLYAAPYNLNGAGTTIMVYDSGIVDVNHPDFAGRIVQTDPDTGGANPVPTRSHSTHVAGTALGSGANSNGNDSAGNPNGGTANQWAGVAPGANLATYGSLGNNPSTDVLYDDAGDINADVTTAIGGGIDLTTMSQGNNTGANGFPCAQLGDYTNTAILLDNIVRGGIGGQQLVYVQSAGNERNQACAGATGFSTISSPATAKNTVVVGAINSNDNSMTNFSSWGPVDDGRLRPDVVGPGCQNGGDNGITSPDFLDADNDGNLDAGETTNAYTVKCGTSMATPAVAGGLALLIEQWRSTRGPGSRPLGHTAKAVAIHTATDLGNAGPDFQFGWGQYNAQAAVDLVRADDTADLIHVDQVDAGQTDTWTFNSDGSGILRVTLVWSDPAATRLAATTLINDLDLRLVSPGGTVVQPLVLNAGSPANNAAAGNDNVNNVEMVVTGAAAGTWEVRVSGTAVPTGPQQYTLVTPADAALNGRPVADAGGPYATVEGTDAALDGSGSSDPDGDPLTYEWDLDNDGQYDDATGPTPTFDRVGQDGVFTVGLRVTDPDGAFATDQAQVTVANVAPSFAALATNGPRDENTAITVTGTATDPGWLDTLTVSVDWNDGSPVQTLSGAAITASENVRPDATVSFTTSHVYGDDGTFSATLCVADDDTTTCQAVPLPYDNVDPTAAIDTAGTILVNGVPTFLAQVGQPVTFTGDATDPGSDDLTLRWDFDDGTPVVATTYLVNPPNPDPPLSPSVQPRDVSDTTDHTFTGACLYVIGFDSTDDDGGASPVANAHVVIVGTDPQTRSAGFWSQQYRGGGPNRLSAETLQCYLDIAGHMSAVFHEVRNASTRPAALAVLQPGGNGGSAIEIFDRQLLAAWVNFANGSIGYAEAVDTDGDGTADTPFHAAVAAAEGVRLNPAATAAQVEAQKDILERINLRHGG
jgi:subtilisin family serine protease